MKIKEMHEEIIKIGIAADPRGKKAIRLSLEDNKRRFQSLTKPEKEVFDKECLSNPFLDTRIVTGDKNSIVRKVMVGVDIDTAELILVDRLNDGQKQGIDLVLSHHPVGTALAAFYQVMDLQIDIMSSRGLSVSLSEDLLKQRKREVERKISSVNFMKTVMAAEYLGINLMSAHTPADNLAYRFLESTFAEVKPSTLGEVINSLLDIGEYKKYAVLGCPPRIVNGSYSSRVKNIHYEFTGGTEGPVESYRELSRNGIDTIIAMHQSEEHFKAAKESHINVIMAGHTASDVLGLNLLLDKLLRKYRFDILGCSGFVRIRHQRRA